MATKEQRQKVLGEILSRDGGITASAVLRAAKPAKSPIHSDFEWDDTVAGHQYRLSQARRIIQITTIRDKTGAEARLVNVPVASIESPTAVIGEREGVYRPIKDVVKDPGDYRKCLQQLVSQRNAMDQTIGELRRAAKRERPGKRSTDLMGQLSDALAVAKSTLRLLLKEA